MRKDNEPKMQALNWILQFVSEDLDSLSDLDYSRRVIEAEYYLIIHEYLDMGLIMQFGSRDVPSKDCTRGEFQLWLREGKGRDNLKGIQSGLKDFLEKEVLAKRVGSDPLSLDVGKVRFLLAESQGLWFTRYVPDLKSSLPPASRFLHMARMRFAHYLDHVSSSAIKSCQECGKYFLHLSLKPKYYCSPKCASRAISRRRRQKDPEGYRAKQREIMRRKYSEERATRLQPSADNGDTGKTRTRQKGKST